MLIPTHLAWLALHWPPGPCSVAELPQHWLQSVPLDSFVLYPGKGDGGEGRPAGRWGLGGEGKELCQLWKHTGGNVVSHAPAAGWSHVQDLPDPQGRGPTHLHLSNLAPVLPAAAQNRVWVLELSFHNQALCGSGDVLILFGCVETQEIT